MRLLLLGRACQRFYLSLCSHSSPDTSWKWWSVGAQIFPYTYSSRLPLTKVSFRPLVTLCKLHLHIIFVRVSVKTTCRSGQRGGMPLKGRSMTTHLSSVVSCSFKQVPCIRVLELEAKKFQVNHLLCRVLYSLSSNDTVDSWRKPLCFLTRILGSQGLIDSMW